MILSVLNEVWFCLSETEFSSFPEQNSITFVSVVAVNDFPMPIYVVSDAGIFCSAIVFECVFEYFIDSVISIDSCPVNEASIAHSSQLDSGSEAWFYLSIIYRSDFKV